MGLWVEIWVFQTVYRKSCRQPPCGAVSWNDEIVENIKNPTVSPLVGLWVEILIVLMNSWPLLSAPLWGCELKYWKLSLWWSWWSQPPCGAVSWNTLQQDLDRKSYRQPPCGAVSWNVTCIIQFQIDFCQPPCGAVSWNPNWLCHIQVHDVSPLVGLWVEISPWYSRNGKGCVSPLVGLWVEMLHPQQKHLYRQCQPPCGAVSWNAQDKSLTCLFTCQPPCGAVSWNITGD